MMYIEHQTQKIACLFVFLTLPFASHAYDDYLDRAISRSEVLDARPLISEAEAKAKLTRYLSQSQTGVDHGIEALVDSMDYNVMQLVRQGHHPRDLGLSVKPPLPSSSGEKPEAPNEKRSSTGKISTGSGNKKTNEWVTMGQQK